MELEKATTNNNCMDQEIVLDEKCDFEGHENYDLVAICLDEDCTSEKRLACSKCLVFNHGEHTNACLFLEDLKDPNKLALKAWSKDNLGKQVEQYLKENENIEQEIDIMMDKLMEDIIKETNKAKNIMRKKRVEGKTEVQKTAKQIQTKYEAAYDIKHIRQILMQFMEDKISEESLNGKLEEIIKAREEIEDLNRKNKLVAVYPVIDKEFLQEKQENLIELISSLSSTIRIPNAWTFQKAKVGNNHLIKEVVPGKSLEFNQNQSNQIVYGSEVIKEGNHTWVFKIEMIKKKDESDNEDSDEEEKKEAQEQQNNNNNNNNNNNANQFGGGFGQFGMGGAGVNFNHTDYQFLRNFYVGIINDKKKDNQASYSRGVGGGQDSHSIDIIRNQTVGGYLYFTGNAQKQMSQLFWEKRETYLELHLTLDLDSSKFYIKDKDQETQYEANFQGMFKGVSWRPYVCSMRSKLRVTLVSSLNN